MVKVELPGQVHAWAVTRHAEAQEVMSGHGFAKNYRHWAAFQSGEVPQDWPMLGMVYYDNMLHSDSETHTRLRGLISKGFTPRRVQSLRPRIEQIVERLLDELESAEHGAEGVDLKDRFATRLPMSVICELFGVPEEERTQVQQLVSQVFSSVLTPEEAMDVQARVNEYFVDLVERCRRRPGTDLTSALVEARDAADKLSDKELIDTLWLFMAAGFETTVGVIINAVRALLAHPEQLALVRSGEYPWSAAVEETLRWDTSVAALPFRYPLDDVELGGRLVRKGEPIIVSFASANRDPLQHGADADRFDITRTQAQHVAFGHGPHFCLGAPLARLELEVALPALFARFPDLALARPLDELVPVASLTTNCPTTLPVEYTRPAARNVPRQSGVADHDPAPRQA